MALNLRHQGAWTTVKAGGLRFKESPDNPLLRDFTPDTWVSPTKVYVKMGGQWTDTGYAPTTGSPGAPTLKSWSVTDPISLEVQWTAPVTGVAPTSYNVLLYNQSGTKIAGLTAYPGDLTAKFSNEITANLLAASTNYSITVTSVAVGAVSAVSDTLKVRIGSPQATHQETTYSWSSAEYTMRPTYVSETSHYGDMDGSKSVDLGDPAAGELAPYTTAWVSGGRSSSDDGWEGLEFSLPNAERLLTKVTFITEPTHTLYLGLEVGNTWQGDVSPQSLGIPPGSLLDHTHISGNGDHSTNIRSFVTENWGFTFSDISGLSIAVTDFINLYGTTGTTGSSTTTTTRSPAPIPDGYSLWIDGTGKAVGLIQSGALLTPATNKTGSSTAPFKQNVWLPPSAVWANGFYPGRSSYRLEYGSSNNEVKFRQYIDGIAFNGANAYMKYTNGSVITRSKSSIFTGKLGEYTSTTTTTSGGTAAVPAWRARILDVFVSYKDRVASGTRTVVDAAQVNTVSGPTAW